jgi:acylphosphatase
MTTRRIHAVVRGRVQGVCFRAYTEEEAERIGVRGWVRNRMDGSVEVEAEGTEAELAALQRFLAQGPPSARVESVAIEEREPLGTETGFRIR